MSDYEHPNNALSESHRLEEYELVRVLGVGGFGMTYLAFDHNLNKGVAIKEYLPSGLATRTADGNVAPQASQFSGDFQWRLERFLDEARALEAVELKLFCMLFWRNRFFRIGVLCYPSDVPDAEWALLAPFFARPDPRGNPGRYAKRDVVNAIFYVVKGGIPWRMLPLDFPPWDTVYDQYRRWNQRGVLEQALDALNEKVRHQQGKHEHPTYVLLDSQSVKTQYTVKKTT